MSKGFPDPGPTGPRSASSLLATHSAPCQACAASHQREPGRKRGCVKELDASLRLFIPTSFHNISVLPTAVPPCPVPRPLYLPSLQLMGPGKLPPVEASYHQPVGGISPPCQAPSAVSRIQLSSELAESHFHHEALMCFPRVTLL